ncbi:MAG: DUF4153 domain-containing protein [Anaerovoracaceae bacterium]|jgi:hypothetical protein
MRRIKLLINQILNGLMGALSRFPFTVICLVATAALVCYLIAIEHSPPLILEKIIFSLGVGAFIGMVAQFLIERFDKLERAKLLTYGVALLLTAGYFAIIWPSPEINAEILTRSFVAIFAMTCAVLWIPAYRQRSDFNMIALVHFKSFFTSVLYSGVLAAGIAAILFAVDTLLFNVDNKSYAYMLTVVWIVFAPIYYLALLPRFNDNREWGSSTESEAATYPRFLEILVSYIAIPLFTVYTLVLLVYFAKILITSEWPSGQLGPMVLIYSAIGVVLFVLASLPENSFAKLFRMVFPKVWIPIVLMQMVSVWIRLDAYGVTVARYYVGLFAIFSLVSAVFLSIRPVSKNRYVALLAAAFAILSIIPPVDAFSVSRNSQIHRIETILQSEGMLSEGVLKSKPDASEETRREVTNILQYLEYNSSLEYISWLPEDFEMYRDMDDYFGFDPYYGRNPYEEYEFFYASLDTDVPLDISGYHVSVVIGSFMEIGGGKDFTFEIEGKQYNLIAERINRRDMTITAQDQAGTPLVTVNLLELAQSIKEMTSEGKDVLPPEVMSYSRTDNGAEIKVIFQYVSLENIGTDNFYADYTAYILFRAP